MDHLSSHNKSVRLITNMHYAGYHGEPGTLGAVPYTYTCMHACMHGALR